MSVVVLAKGIVLACACGIAQQITLQWIDTTALATLPLGVKAVLSIVGPVVYAWVLRSPLDDAKGNKEN